MKNKKDNVKENAKKNVSGLAEYGKKLVELGEAFQDETTTIEELFKKCHTLGLIISFRVEPDPKQSVDEKVKI